MTGPAASGGQGQGPEDEAGQASVPLMPLLRADLSKDGIDLEQEITRTAMSVVFRGTDRRHARPVAIKLLGPAATAGADSDALLHEIPALRIDSAPAAGVVRPVHAAAQPKSGAMGLDPPAPASQEWRPAARCRRGECAA